MGEKTQEELMKHLSEFFKVDSKPGIVKRGAVVAGGVAGRSTGKILKKVMFSPWGTDITLLRVITLTSLITFIVLIYSFWGQEGNLLHSIGDVIVFLAEILKGDKDNSFIWIVFRVLLIIGLLSFAKKRPGLVLFVVCCTYIIHALWVILVFTNPDRICVTTLKDAGDITTGNAKCPPWQYYGPVTAANSDIEDSTYDYSKYLLNLDIWEPPDHHGDKVIQGCHECGKNMKPVRLPGCGMGDYVGCGKCDGNETWASLKCIKNDLNKGCKGLSAGPGCEPTNPCCQTVGTKCISKNPLHGFDTNFLGKDAKGNLPDDGVGGVCLSPNNAKSNNAVYSDMVGEGVCGHDISSPQDAYEDCIYKAPHYLELEWDKNHAGYGPVYPGQEFEINNTTHKFTVPIPRPHGPECKGIDNKYNNNFHNPICDTPSDGDKTKCSVKIPVMTQPVHDITKSQLKIRGGVSDNSIPTPPCESSNRLADEYNNGKMLGILIKPFDKPNKDINSTPFTFASPSTGADTPMWARTLDMIRSDCLSDKKGKCFMTDSMCTTFDSLDPTNIVSHVPTVGPGGTLNIKELSDTGCQNTYLPCPKESDPCTAMQVDKSGNIISLPGVCNTGEYDATGKFEVLPKGTELRCTPKGTDVFAPFRNVKKGTTLLDSEDLTVHNLHNLSTELCKNTNRVVSPSTTKSLSPHITWGAGSTNVCKGVDDPSINEDCLSKKWADGKPGCLLCKDSPDSSGCDSSNKKKRKNYNTITYGTKDTKGKDYSPVKIKNEFESNCCEDKPVDSRSAVVLWYEKSKWSQSMANTFKSQVKTALSTFGLLWDGKEVKEGLPNTPPPGSTGVKGKSLSWSLSNISANDASSSKRIVQDIATKLNIPTGNISLTEKYVAPKKKKEPLIDNWSDTFRTSRTRVNSKDKSWTIGLNNPNINVSCGPYCSDKKQNKCPTNVSDCKPSHNDCCLCNPILWTKDPKIFTGESTFDTKSSNLITGAALKGTLNSWRNNISQPITPQGWMTELNNNKLTPKVDKNTTLAFRTVEDGWIVDDKNQDWPCFHPLDIDEDYFPYDSNGETIHKVQYSPVRVTLDKNKNISINTGRTSSDNKSWMDQFIESDTNTISGIKGYYEECLYGRKDKGQSKNIFITSADNTWLCGETTGYRSTDKLAPVPFKINEGKYTADTLCAAINNEHNTKYQGKYADIQFNYDAAINKIKLAWTPLSASALRRYINIFSSGGSGADAGSLGIKLGFVKGLIGHGAKILDNSDGQILLEVAANSPHFTRECLKECPMDMHRYQSSSLKKKDNSAFDTTKSRQTICKRCSKGSGTIKKGSELCHACDMMGKESQKSPKKGCINYKPGEYLDFTESPPKNNSVNPKAINNEKLTVCSCDSGIKPSKPLIWNAYGDTLETFVEECLETKGSKGTPKKSTGCRIKEVAINKGPLPSTSSIWPKTKTVPDPTKLSNLYMNEVCRSITSDNDALASNNESLCKSVNECKWDQTQMKCLLNLSKIYNKDEDNNKGKDKRELGIKAPVLSSVGTEQGWDKLNHFNPKGWILQNKCKLSAGSSLKTPGSLDSSILTKQKCKGPKVLPDGNQIPVCGLRNDKFIYKGCIPEENLYKLAFDNTFLDNRCQELHKANSTLFDYHVNKGPPSRESSPKNRGCYFTKKYCDTSKFFEKDYMRINYISGRGALPEGCPQDGIIRDNTPCKPDCKYMGMGTPAVCRNGILTPPTCPLPPKVIPQGKSVNKCADITGGDAGDTLAKGATKDGIVNVEDLLAMLKDYGRTGPGLVSDISQDSSNAVNVEDLLVLMAQYGRTTAACLKPKVGTGKGGTGK